MPDRIYLDHAATTPILPRARAAVARDGALGQSVLAACRGARARAALEEGAGAIAAALGWRHDVIFTSGASEAVCDRATRARIERRVVGAVRA